MPKLSILICTLESRKKLFDKLFYGLVEQTKNFGNDVHVLIECDNGEKSIGEKRNELLERATGEYLVMIDDDDEIPNDYVDLLMKAVESGCDCASLRGKYYIDGKFEGIFEHSIKYAEWKTNNNGAEVRFERFPNHLNLIKSSIAKQFRYPEKNFGEDFDWSTKVHKSGLIKTEYYISEILYQYKFITIK